MIISGSPGVRGRGIAINPAMIRIDPVTTLAAWTTLSILSRYPIPVRRKSRLSVISQLAQRETGINASVIYPQLIIRFPYAAPFERSASCLEVGMTGPVILGRAGRTPLPLMPPANYPVSGLPLSAVSHFCTFAQELRSDLHLCTVSLLTLSTCQLVNWPASVPWSVQPSL